MIARSSVLCLLKIGWTPRGIITAFDPRQSGSPSNKGEHIDLDGLQGIKRLKYGVHTKHNTTLIQSFAHHFEIATGPSRQLHTANLRDAPDVGVRASGGRWYNPSRGIPERTAGHYVSSPLGVQSYSAQKKEEI